MTKRSVDQVVGLVESFMRGEIRIQDMSSDILKIGAMVALGEFRDKNRLDLSTNLQDRLDQAIRGWDHLNSGGEIIAAVDTRRVIF